MPYGRVDAEPPHRHAVDSESVYVLEGELRVTDEADRTWCRGEFVFPPPGGAHAFDNPGDEPARALVVAAPGIEAERFFAAVDASAPSPEAVRAMPAQHGVTILPFRETFRPRLSSVGHGAVRSDNGLGELSSQLIERRLANDRALSGRPHGPLERGSAVPGRPAPTLC